VVVTTFIDGGIPNRAGVLSAPQSKRRRIQSPLYRAVFEAVGMWESRSDLQRAVGREDNLSLVFRAFHGPSFHSLSEVRAF
jgi:hypothetical protein